MRCKGIGGRWLRLAGRGKYAGESVAGCCICCIRRGRRCCARWRRRKIFRAGRSSAEGVDRAGVVVRMVQEVDKEPRPNHVQTPSFLGPEWVPMGPGGSAGAVKPETGSADVERERAGRARGLGSGKRRRSCRSPLLRHPRPMRRSLRERLHVHVRARAPPTLSGALRGGRSGGAALSDELADFLGKVRKEFLEL